MKKNKEHNSFSQNNENNKMNSANHADGHPERNMFENSFIDLITYPVLVLNSNHNIVYFNEHACEELIISCDKLRGADYLDIDMRHDKKSLDELLSNLAKVGILNIKSIFKTGKDTVLMADVTLIFHRFAGKDFYVIYFNIVPHHQQKSLVQNVLYNISVSAQTTESPDILFKDIQKILSEYLDTGNFYIALYDEDTDSITLPFFIDSKDVLPTSFPIKGTLTGHVIKTGEPMLLQEEDMNRMTDEGLIEIIGTASKVWLGVPLINQNKVIGVMAVQHYTDPKAYNEHDLEFLKLVSNQIGLSLEHRLSHDALLKSESELRKANAAKDKFFSIMAHDLKTPFSGLLGLSKMLADPHLDIPLEEIKDMANDIHISAETLYKLLENLLDWSRIQRDTINFDPCDFTVISVVENAVNNVKKHAARKKITINNNVDPDIGIHADINMFCTIIRNITTNAIKYTHKGGTVSINTSIENDETVVLSVTDTGVGMDEDALDKVFLIEHSYSTTGTDQETGTGLGLILCKELVKKNKGSVSIESEPGKGTTVRIFVPLVKE